MKDIDQMSEKLQEHIATALENDWIDIDSDNVSDYELDAVETMMTHMQLEDTIQEVQKTAKRVEAGYKHSFLHRYMENQE